ncbi:MAG: 4'-phosphopantetheinyl transferase superfamily protein [Deltaproteobacteria bacterium]|nr:4'-phosphopantetheinyl transferase superfamily protein [Deltaproteobacteria bacterium]MBW2362955.1 4'-phosphopantetheinyl transferase superfamily protein [Deltaproteobacteria bacterium]
MLEALFPPGVVAVSADAAELWDAALHPGEVSTIAHAAASRQREFAVGRACARAALARLGLSAGPIPRTALRAPAWPDGATGSITHCRGYCAAAVARCETVRALGIDAERTGRVTWAILERVTTEREREVLGTMLPGDAPQDWPTLVWCAKESVLKCLAGATDRMPGPREISIELARERFTARLLSARLSGVGVAELRGRVVRHGSLVLAGVALPTANGLAAAGAVT